jgi:hypothetical protein
MENDAIKGLFYDTIFLLHPSEKQAVLFLGTESDASNIYDKLRM